MNDSEHRPDETLDPVILAHELDTAWLMVEEARIELKENTAALNRTRKLLAQSTARSDGYMDIKRIVERARMPLRKTEAGLTPSQALKAIAEQITYADTRVAYHERTVTLD